MWEAWNEATKRAPTSVGGLELIDQEGAPTSVGGLE